MTISDTTAPGAAAICPVCPRHCVLSAGQAGFCRARKAEGDRVVAENYARVTSLALDPIEKKPLAHFCPGGLVLSVGSYGCNLRCPFCQNHEISQCGGETPARTMTPAELAQEAQALVPKGNVGVAFTYNEPSVGWEYVRDAAMAAKTLDLKTVMVTNGCYCQPVRNGLAGLIDAYNIDLKCFTEEGYRSLGGDLGEVLETICAAHADAHLEVTTLVVPDLSDSAKDMERQASFLAGLSRDIPLHISRYFPRWQQDTPATPLDVMHNLARVARRYLKHVHLGNC